MKFKLARNLKVLYKSVVRWCLEYADVVWDGGCDTFLKTRYNLNRLDEGFEGYSYRVNLLKETTWRTLKERRVDHKLFMMYKIVLMT